jgi:hypothetical protein
MSGCKAFQQSDQMVCHRCGLIWDMNDPEPPACGLTTEVSQLDVQEYKSDPVYVTPEDAHRINGLADRLRNYAESFPSAGGLLCVEAADELQRWANKCQKV